MDTHKPLILIIFGATGDLYADKLAKALYILFLEHKIHPDFKIIAFARKDFTQDAFRALSKRNILKKGNINASKLDEFLNCIEYFKGDFLDAGDFVKLKNFLSPGKNRAIIFHVASPSAFYKDIFENIKNAGAHLVNQGGKILIEKPFGGSGPDAKLLSELLSSMFEEEHIFHVDHYLAKETAERIFDFRFKYGSLDNVWDIAHIEKIKIIFHESNIVGCRGASYDSVGAFLDVGENHMLELLALMLMPHPKDSSAESIRGSRAKALSDLYIDYNYKIIKGQYEGYQAEPGVAKDSTTETFFRVFLKSKAPRFSNIPFELEAGKGLLDMHSDITTTTVSAQVYFKDGRMKEFKIQPVQGTQYNSYTKVYTDAFVGDQRLFVSMDEIVVEWRLADELLSKWKDVPLVKYKKGAKAEDIK